MRRYILFIIFSSLLPLGIAAQEETFEELFEDGNYFFNRNEFSEAAYLYKRALRMEPNNYNLNYKIGRSYLNIEGEEEKAIPYFIKATENVTLKYKEHKISETRAPYHVKFYLGSAYRITNDLQKALEALEDFRSLKNFEDHYNTRVSEEEMKAVARAKIIQDAPLELDRFCYQEPINSTGIEYKAVLSANENVMVWMNSQKFYEAIMMSIKKDGKWTRAINITPQVGSDGDLEPTGLSADGTELLLVKRDMFDSDIYYSKFDGTFWSKAEPMTGLINSNFHEDHASFSSDGKLIFVASDRRGTIGGLDIFVAEKQGDNEWSEPKNLGTTINTEFDETSAYLSPDKSKLLFSSKGHFNMGGYDIFVSEIRNDEFSFAYNIGFPVNTTTDNTFFVPIGDGTEGISSIRDEEGVGHKDVWRFDILPYEEMVAAETHKRLSKENFTITLIDPDTKEKIILDYNSVEDKVLIKSSTGKEYLLYYSRESNE